MKRIAAKYLNLRSEPLVKPSTLLVGLPFGHPVEILKPSSRVGWYVVKTDYSGKSWEGHISGRFLRDSLGKKIEDALSFAAIEWDRFKRGKGKEYNDPFYRYVAEYWTARGYSYTGKDRKRYWSAACISWFFDKAGYTGFKFAVAHARFIHEAIKARDKDKNKDFWGYRISEKNRKLVTSLPAEEPNPLILTTITRSRKTSSQATPIW